MRDECVSSSTRVVEYTLCRQDTQYRAYTAVYARINADRVTGVGGHIRLRVNPRITTRLT